MPFKGFSITTHPRRKGRHALTSIQQWPILFPSTSTSNGDATPDSYTTRSCCMICLAVSCSPISFKDLLTLIKKGILQLVNGDANISKAGLVSTTLQVRSQNERLYAPAERSCVSEIATNRENMYRSPIQVSVVFDGHLDELV